MRQQKHPDEAMTGAPGALLGEAIRTLILIVAAQKADTFRVTTVSLCSSTVADTNSTSE
jgi:hypothetical protein